MTNTLLACASPRLVVFLSLVPLGAAFPLPAQAQMSCAELGAWLAKDPTVLPVNATSPLAALTGTGDITRPPATKIRKSRWIRIPTGTPS